MKRLARPRDEARKARPAGGPLNRRLAAWVLAAAATLAATVAPAAGAQGVAAVPALPEAALRAALLAAPGQAAAEARQALGSAEAAQRRADPYEWVARAGVQRRSEAAGTTHDRELALERTLRWGDKPALDRRLGDQTAALAALQRRQAWHEDAGQLLAAWFELARDARSLAHQRAQLQLADEQLQAVRRRVAAGDAAVLEQRQAEGEREAAAAALARAGQRWAAGAQALRLSHPALAGALPDPDAAPTPEAAASPLEAGPDEALAAQIVARHPALAVADAERDLARLQQQRVAADRVADPTVGLRMAQERSGAERVLGLTLSLPLGGEARDRRLALEAAQAALAERQAEALRRRVATDAARTAADPARLAQVQARLQAAAEAARASARLTERARAAGEATLGELLQQRRLAGEAALAAALAAIDAQEARARLQLALQQLLPPPH